MYYKNKIVNLNYYVHQKWINLAARFANGPQSPKSLASRASDSCEEKLGFDSGPLTK